MPSTGSQPEPVGRSHLRLPPPPEHPPLCREAFAPPLCPCRCCRRQREGTRASQLSPQRTTFTNHPPPLSPLHFHHKRPTLQEILPNPQSRFPQHPCPPRSPAGAAASLPGSVPCPRAFGDFPQNEAFSLPAAPPGPAALSWGGMFAMERQRGEPLATSRPPGHPPPGTAGGLQAEKPPAVLALAPHQLPGDPGKHSPPGRGNTPGLVMQSPRGQEASSSSSSRPGGTAASSPSISGGQTAPGRAGMPGCGFRKRPCTPLLPSPSTYRC